MKCVICNKEYTGYGNNAEPIAEGMCCDNCNTTYVLPARLKQLKIEKKIGDKKVRDKIVGYIVRSVYGSKEYKTDNENKAVEMYLKDFPKAKKEDITLQGIGSLDNPTDKMIFENRDAETTEDVKRREIGNLIREEVNAIESYDNTVLETILSADEKRILEHIRNEEIEHTDELNSIYKNLKSEDVQDDSNLKESFAGQYDPADVNEPLDEEPVELQDEVDLLAKLRGLGNFVTNMMKKALDCKSVEDDNNLEESSFDIGNFDMGESGEISQKENEEMVENVKDAELTEDDIYNALEQVYKGSELGTLSIGNIMTTVNRVTGKTPDRKLVEKVYNDIQNSIYDDDQEVQSTLEENEISNSIQDDLDRNIYEGWTPRDFINELEPQFKYAVNRFNSKEDVKEWCMSNQPFYKKYVPEVVSYFVKKWESAKNNSLYDNDEVYGDGEEVEEQIEALSENTVEARDSRDYSQYVGRNLYEVAKELGITGWNRMDDFFTYTFYNGNQSIEFETDGRGTIKGVKANMKDCDTVQGIDKVNDGIDEIQNDAVDVAKQLGVSVDKMWDAIDKYTKTHNVDFKGALFYSSSEWPKFERWFKRGMRDSNCAKSVNDSDTVNDIGMYAKGSKYRWQERYGNAQLTLMCVCEDDTIKLSLDNANTFVKLPREKFEEMLRDKTIVCTDTVRIDGYDRIKTQDKKFSVKVGDRQFIVKAKDSLEARNKIKAKFAK